MIKIKKGYLEFDTEFDAFFGEVETVTEEQFEIYGKQEYQYFDGAGSDYIDIAVVMCDHDGTGDCDHIGHGYFDKHSLCGNIFIDFYGDKGDTLLKAKLEIEIPSEGPIRFVYKLKPNNWMLDRNCKIFDYINKCEI
jgi:hypothetical protein